MAFSQPGTLLLVMGIWWWADNELCSPGAYISMEKDKEGTDSKQADSTQKISAKQKSQNKLLWQKVNCMTTLSKYAQRCKFKY